MDRITWRYQRQRDVLYIRAHQERANHYALTWPNPDGTKRTLCFANVAPLYDHLHLLERDLATEGWELLPAEQRASNRLPTPICDTCWERHPVETTLRTPTHVHFRCAGCHYTWMVPKPGTVPP